MREKMTGCTVPDEDIEVIKRLFEPKSYIERIALYFLTQKVVDVLNRRDKFVKIDGGKVGHSGWSQEE